jgi:hypothetical protein
MAAYSDSIIIPQFLAKMAAQYLPFPDAFLKRLGPRIPRFKRAGAFRLLRRMKMKRLIFRTTIAVAMLAASALSGEAIAGGGNGVAKFCEKHPAYCPCTNPPAPLPFCSK